MSLGGFVFHGAGAYIHVHVALYMEWCNANGILVLGWGAEAGKAVEEKSKHFKFGVRVSFAS